MASGDADEEKPVLVLFRHDLRLADNGALNAAARSGKPVLPVFILDEQGHGALGAARRWWLHHSLQKLDDSLRGLGAPPVLRRGAMLQTVEDLVHQSGADMVVWNRRYDGPGMAADAALQAALLGQGVEAKSFAGHLMHEPARLATGSGTPFKVYSAFWRAFMRHGEPPDPIPAPARLKGLSRKLPTDLLGNWKLLPETPDWAAGLRDEWTPGERGAHARLDHFLAGPVDGYAEARDVPGVQGTSRLSPHLTHGEITPAQIWHALLRAQFAPSRDAEVFRKELVWREFCWHLLFHNPHLAAVNYDRRFDRFPWAGDRTLLAAWQRGLTGYPIVDAGMRELWRTGFMHNRVRMIVASFLTKHLLIDWRDGEKWFWDTLVDADPANNPANWQWVAGSGADASPYFRIFNPTLQGQKFDVEGAYVRRNVPELSHLPDKFIHRPWDAPATILTEAGVKLGQTYPVAVIEHRKARDRAMRAFRTMRGGEE